MAKEEEKTSESEQEQEEDVSELEEELEPQQPQFQDFMQESFSDMPITQVEAPVLQATPTQEAPESLESQVADIPSSKKDDDEQVEYSNKGTAYAQSYSQSYTSQENSMTRDSQLPINPSFHQQSNDFQSFTFASPQEIGATSMRDKEREYMESLPSFEQEKTRRGFERRS